MHSEEALIAGARKLDEDILADIYDRYSPGLYRYAFRMLGTPEMAEDCVAETFSRFLHALHRGGGPRQYLQAYLYRVAHNWVTDVYRQNSPDMVPLDVERAESGGHGPEEEVQNGLEFDRARAALLQLTPDQRQVIVLKFLEGWNNREIAKALEKPVGAVKSLQHRGLASLKRILVSSERLA